jgi:hypothetical protein
MNCEQAKPYLYDRALNEITRDPEAEAHVAACQVCRAELADLELTRKLMRQGLPEEEPRRRIAFVADPPAPAHNPLRFWQWSFAGAAAVAMLFAVLAIRRPSPTAPIASPTATSAPIATFTRADVDAIVAQAVAASEQRQRAETAQVIQAAAQDMSEQLHYLHSTQSQVYKQSEQNRSDLRQVAVLLSGREGVRQ